MWLTERIIYKCFQGPGWTAGMKGQVQGQSLMGPVSEVVQEEVWVWVLTENLSADRGCWEDGWTDGHRC